MAHYSADIFGTAAAAARTRSTEPRSTNSLDFGLCVNALAVDIGLMLK